MGNVAIVAIALIVFVVEPMRILFVNFVLPKVLIPKIKHYSDPAQIPTPYRTKLPVFAVDLVDTTHVVDTFQTLDLPLPKRLKESGQVIVPQNADPADDRRSLQRPKVDAPWASQVSDACAVRRWRNRVVKKQAQALKNIDEDDDPDHANQNYEHRTAQKRLWDPSAIADMKSDLDFKPPLLYSAVLFFALLVNILPASAEEMIIEETLNFWIMFGVSTANGILVLGNLDGTPYAPWLIALFFIVVFAFLVYLPWMVGKGKKVVAGAGLVRARFVAAPDQTKASDSALRLKRALAMLYDDFGDLRPSPLSRAASSMFSGSPSEEKTPDDDDAPGAFG